MCVLCRIFDKNDYLKLSDDKIADEISVQLKWCILYDWEENILEKGENAGYQHFPIFPESLPRIVKVGWKRESKFELSFFMRFLDFLLSKGLSSCPKVFTKKAMCLFKRLS